ncbi:MAG: formate/nitrite transporter family protein [Oceanicoccus sp.]|uniref:formate/nitrite transporter family protein n=1 Tax=Oceanicoccus sp. TaxID=2691044 RepID=UPI00261609D2|nr:formate/nitrite transporter family protein [Oceanicoccus sp.]MDG1772477.1 formate/nitrite transporter family protein [Oceanicoccus sp.]
MDPVNDAYSPQQIAERVNNAGVNKATLPVLQTLTLGILAGAFIAFGAMFYTLVITDSLLGFGPTRLLGGMAFSLGLVLVIIAGAELFTGNNLIVIAWAEKKISIDVLLGHWLLVYIANLIGALGSAGLVVFSGIMNSNEGAVAATAISIAEHKVALSPLQAFVRGVLCNTLVCLAVWLCYAAHTVSGKILAVGFPITAFVALGFEHSIANMYLISSVIFQGDTSISWMDFANNLIPVTAGNIIGGSVLVAMVYWLCYLYKPGKKEGGL